MLSVPAQHFVSGENVEDNGVVRCTRAFREHPPIVLLLVDEIPSGRQLSYWLLYFPLERDSSYPEAL